MRSKKYIKGFLADIVLHLIHENGEMYGYEITKKVQEITNGAIKVTEGALYPILHKLENDGQLTSNYKKANGRLRKYYQITSGGSEMAVSALADLRDFLGSLSAVFNLNPIAK